jgi:hypothetical protein
VTAVKYTSPATTPLVRTVGSGTNEFDFDVEPAGRR